LHAGAIRLTLMLASDTCSTSPPALDLYKSVLALRDEAIQAKSVHSDEPNALILATQLEYALLDFLAAFRVDDEGNLHNARLRARHQHGTPMLRLTPAVRARATDGNDDAGDDAAQPPQRAPRRAAPSEPALSARPPPPLDFKGLCRAVLASPSYGVQCTPHHGECAAPAMKAVRLEAGPEQTTAYKAAALWMATHPMPEEFRIAHIPADLSESLRPYLHLIMFLTRLKLVSDGQYGAAVPFSHRKARQGTQVLFISLAIPARHEIAQRLLDNDDLAERLVNGIRRAHEKGASATWAELSPTVRDFGICVHGSADEKAMAKLAHEALAQLRAATH